MNSSHALTKSGLVASRTAIPITVRSFSRSLYASGQKSEEADVCPVLPRARRGRDVDELDALVVEPLGRLREPRPVGVRAAEDDLALLEERVERGLQIERLRGQPGPRDEVLEVDEQRDALILGVALHRRNLTGIRPRRKETGPGRIQLAARSPGPEDARMAEPLRPDTVAV